MKIGLLVSLLLIAFVSPTLVVSCNTTKIAEKENRMVPKAMMPPIDASVPSNTETATFALG